MPCAATSSCVYRIEPGALMCEFHRLVFDSAARGGVGFRRRPLVPTLSERSGGSGVVGSDRACRRCGRTIAGHNRSGLCWECGWNMRGRGRKTVEQYLLRCEMLDLRDKDERAEPCRRCGRPVRPFDGLCFDCRAADLLRLQAEIARASPAYA